MNYITCTDGTLRCPICGFGYTHHGVVNVYNRETEDSEIGIHACVNGTSCNIDYSMIGNPSRRRDGISIQMRCENGCKFVLHIIQHKGETHLYTISQ